MSKQGIKIAADIFSAMQEGRRRLLELAGKAPYDSKTAHQDILLGQMFEDAKDMLKNRFCQITIMKTEDSA